ncbi:MAG TPA: tRNA (guanosine(46)-N7)-methyltransferase TrmB [Pilimelia sp.]|nr:tRNA (guanosine(46)-N7)-methyltransferase TrmB [Pilimelia sp.]
MNPATAVPPARIRSYPPRRGRLRARHLDALERLWPAYGVTVADVPDEPLNPARLFGRHAPLVLEIGSGMGEATADMAAADPDRDYLAVEVYPPGIANLLSVIDSRGLTNVRVARGDALDLLRHQIAPGALDAVHVFFPDPWPKTRHHKRRLIQPAHLDLFHSRLVRGGTLHCATDCPAYAEAMLDTLVADPRFHNAYAGFAPRPTHRPATRYEQQGVAAGRRVFDLVFRTLQLGSIKYARGPR